jgi:hypothetical protein
MIRQMFRPVPRSGFHGAIFKRKRLLGRTSYPTFLDLGPSNTETIELQELQMARISAANESKHFGNLLRKPGQVLLTPGQYELLGARIVVLSKESVNSLFYPFTHRQKNSHWGKLRSLRLSMG